MFQFININIVLVSSSRQGQLAGTCDRGTATSGSVIHREFLE